MSGYVSAQVPIKVTKADGTFFWSGVGRLGVIHNCLNADGGAVKTVSDGDAIELLNSATIICRTDYTAADQAGGTLPPADVLGVQRSATTMPVIGVAMEPCPLGGNFQVAGSGSIMAVRTTGTLTINSATVGHVATSATQGSCVGSFFAAAFVGKIVGPVLTSASITGGTGNRHGVYVSCL